jgi:hypothetical protein
LIALSKGQDSRILLISIDNVCGPPP